MAPQNQPKSGGVSRFSKNLSFWLILALVPIVLLQFMARGAEQVVEIDASAYYAQLDADNIAKVTVVGGKEITGEFKSRALVKTISIKSFKTLLPIANNPEDMKRLEAKDRKSVV